tara:strand:+ start:29144 stop:30889 length:1746 start_codon:yes stop_codon:yes gene_type:complete
MALRTSESPAVTIREVDLSGIVPAVSSSTGALVGDFNWGPLKQPILVGNEAELIANFGAPTLVEDSNNVDFLSAASFLKYSGTLQVVRGKGPDESNAIDSSVGTQLVENLADWNTKKSGLATGTTRFVAKYAGKAGNSLQVSVCPWSTNNDSAFENWAYKANFDGAPGTSSFVTARSADGAAAHDEIHVAIVDQDGKFSGSPGTVLETWDFLSLATDAKADDGTNNFCLDVLNSKSDFVWASSINPQQPTNVTAADFGTSTVSGTGFNARTASFTGGDQSTYLNNAAYDSAFASFEDEDNIQVDFLIAPGLATTQDQDTISERLIEIASARKDCVVVTSPPKESIVDVQNSNTIVTNVTTFAKGVTNSSYLIVDGNWLKVYDKYNDKYVYIPAASSTAGLMAATDEVSAPWFSPAGNRRGQYFGVSSLAWNPTKSQRDTLYKASVNPIVNLPGQGVILFGDKTKLNRPSAFDRINVRRLFLVMERAIKSAAQNVMFEFNDDFTRAEFVNIVEPFLRDIKGRRGISDFRVVCDETNNTSDVIDNNQFVADIFVKPARSINYVTLSFVAVRTGVDFEEVVGLA